MDLTLHARWLKIATTKSRICHGSGARLSAIASGLTRKPSRSAAAAAVAQQQAGMATTADLMTVAAAEQTRDGSLAASPSGNAHGKHWQTGCNQQHLQCHAEDLSRSRRSSQAVQDQRLDPEELGREP